MVERMITDFDLHERAELRKQRHTASFAEYVSAATRWRECVDSQEDALLARLANAERLLDVVLSHVDLDEVFDGPFVNELKAHFAAVAGDGAAREDSPND